MDLSSKRCGECGANAYVRKNIKGPWQRPWRDYPAVLLAEELSLWTCQACSSSAVTPGDAEKIDTVIERSIRGQSSQFLDIIKSNSGLSFDEVAMRLGIAPSCLSRLRSGNKTPSFHLWSLFKAMASDPKVRAERLNPAVHRPADPTVYRQDPRKKN